MTTSFFFRTARVFFFLFLTLSSTCYLLEAYGAEFLKWRAGSSSFLAYTMGLKAAGFDWAGQLNNVVVVLYFLCGGVMVSMITALLLDGMALCVAKRFQSSLK